MQFYFSIRKDYTIIDIQYILFIISIYVSKHFIHFLMEIIAEIRIVCGMNDLIIFIHISRLWRYVNTVRSL